VNANAVDAVNAVNATNTVNKVFLLSPARCDGRRGEVLMNPTASFALAERSRSRQGAPLGDVFSFLSGLYFRGKLAYAGMFGARTDAVAHTFVITTNRGLMTPDTNVRRRDLMAFSEVDIATRDERYLKPLRRDVRALASALGANATVVLLGSIATGKYVDTFTEVFGERLVFPTEFVGRGDMSRGGLLLRCVREGRELAYQPVIGAVRHGKRPAKLERVR
jgi:hypothetical protein